MPSYCTYGLQRSSSKEMMKSKIMFTNLKRNRNDLPPPMTEMPEQEFYLAGVKRNGRTIVYYSKKG